MQNCCIDTAASHDLNIFVKLCKLYFVLNNVVNMENSFEYFISPHAPAGILRDTCGSVMI